MDGDPGTLGRGQFSGLWGSKLPGVGRPRWAFGNVSLKCRGTPPLLLAADTAFSTKSRSVSTLHLARLSAPFSQQLLLTSCLCATLWSFSPPLKLFHYYCVCYGDVWTVISELLLWLAEGWEDEVHLSARMNFLIKACAFLFFFLRHNGISYLIDYSESVNITFLGSGKPKRSCDFLNFNSRSAVVSWSQTKPLWGLPAIVLFPNRSVMSDSVIPWAAARQPSLFSISRSLLKRMSIKPVMPSSHLSSAAAFSSCPQSLPASGSFPMSQRFASRGQSIGASTVSTKEKLLPNKYRTKLNWYLTWKMFLYVKR